eukprot:6765300-Prorocentrum_lima.AAC.1
MTSSLVGSEMCIRDRKKLRAGSDYQPHSARAKCEVIHPALYACRYCKAAVSYTHLTLPTICSV